MRWSGRPRGTIGQRRAFLTTAATDDEAMRKTLYALSVLAVVGAFAGQGFWIQHVEREQASGIERINRELTTLTSTDMVMNYRLRDAGIVIGQYSNELLTRDGEAPVSCPTPETTHVILTLGQSHLSNSAEAPGIEAGENAYNLNWWDGRCYKAKDPLIGTDGRLANVGTRIVRNVIGGGAYKHVVIVPISIGSSRIEQWVPGGDLHHKIPVAIWQLAKQRLKPDTIIWWQGAANSPDNDPGGERYKTNLVALIKSLRDSAPNADIFITPSTTCGPIMDHAVDIRSAQKAAVSPAERVFQGPDMDALGKEYRDQKECHLNERGAEEAARQWAEVLAARKAARAH